MDEKIFNKLSLQESNVTQPYEVDETATVKHDYNPIEIRFLSRGCVVRVGCKEIPFEDSLIAIDEIRKYIENPAKVTEEWLKKLN